MARSPITGRSGHIRRKAIDDQDLILATRHFGTTANFPNDGTRPINIIHTTSHDSEDKTAVDMYQPQILRVVGIFFIARLATATVTISPIKALSVLQSTEKKIGEA
jgi:hypothetical protein